MIRITEQLCTQTLLTEDRLRLQSYTIKIDGPQFKKLYQLYIDAIADAQFQDLPQEEWPKITDIVAAAISRGLDQMCKEL